MKYLNLGCGDRYHKSWINLDFVGKGDEILGHNLLHGIPFENETYDVIYHSHVLEHFSKDDGEIFIRECYRVLKPGGIMRVAVPDLEQIAREYLRNMELAIAGNQDASFNYDWIKLEMYDQTVRNESGGNMAKYIFRENIPNERYVFERIGEEGRKLRKVYQENLSKEITTSQLYSTKKYSRDLNSNFRRFIKLIKAILFRKEIFHPEAEIGKFRAGGEIHQWMYDRYSLNRLFKETGFSTVEIKDAFTSTISDWNTYELDSKNNIVFKPDSIFVEAIK